MKESQPEFGIAFDATPLTQPHYTGIPNVAYQLFRYFRRAYPARFAPFWFDGELLSEVAIEALISAKSGLVLSKLPPRDLFHRTIFAELAKGGRRFVGLFPNNTKPIERLFPVEIQIIYDITPLLAAECHAPETVRHLTRDFERAVETNQLNICISEATRADLVSYVNVPVERTRVLHMGVDAELHLQRKCEEFKRTASVEPFLLVLGTIEPRKNIPLVLDAIRRDPEITRRYTIVFAGRHGWGPTFLQYVLEAGLSRELVSGRLVYLGYIGEAERQALLHNAEFLILPSYYEGFGLPVLEAFAAGCPVLSSLSSSLPEAGGDVALYFDPYDSGDLVRVIHRVMKLSAAELEALREKARARAAEFTWDAFCAGVDRELHAAAARFGIANGPD